MNTIKMNIKTRNQLITIPESFIKNSSVLKNWKNDFPDDNEFEIDINPIYLNVLINHNYNQFGLRRYIRLLQWSIFFDVKEIDITCEMIGKFIDINYSETRFKIKTLQKLLLFEWNVRKNIYKYIKFVNLYEIVTKINDKAFLYALDVAKKEPLKEERIIKINNSIILQKIYDECPIIKELSLDEHTIIAGGFICLACNNLDYKDFPDSDIDIFVCGQDNPKSFYDILNKFDKLGAKFKDYRNVMDIKIPDYHRTFQLIWLNDKTVYECIKNFYGSYVKCGLYQNEIIMTPDCEFSMRTKNVILSNENIPMRLIHKMRMKGFNPIIPNKEPHQDYEKYYLEYNNYLAEHKQNVRINNISITEPCDFSNYGDGSNDCKSSEQIKINYNYDNGHVIQTAELYQRMRIGDEKDVKNIWFRVIKICKDVNFPVFKISPTRSFGEFDTIEELKEIMYNNPLVDSYFQIQDSNKLLKKYGDAIEYDKNNKIIQNKVVGQTNTKYDCSQLVDVTIVNKPWALRVSEEEFIRMHEFDSSYDLCLQKKSKPMRHFQWITKQHKHRGAPPCFIIEIYDKDILIGHGYEIGSDYSIISAKEEYNKQLKIFIRKTNTKEFKKMIYTHNGSRRINMNTNNL